MKYLVYPSDCNGDCINGFCPTVCMSKGSAFTEAYKLHMSLAKYHIEYNDVVISECN